MIRITPRLATDERKIRCNPKVVSQPEFIPFSSNWHNFESNWTLYVKLDIFQVGFDTFRINCAQCDWRRGIRCWVCGARCRVCLEAIIEGNSYGLWLSCQDSQNPFAKTVQALVQCWWVDNFARISWDNCAGSVRLPKISWKRMLPLPEWNREPNSSLYQLCNRLTLVGKALFTRYLYSDLALVFLGYFPATLRSNVFPYSGGVFQFHPLSTCCLWTPFFARAARATCAFHIHRFYHPPWTTLDYVSVHQKRKRTELCKAQKFFWQYRIALQRNPATQ